MSELSDKYMRGIPMKPYDMVREGLIVLTGMATVIVVLAAVWGFPHIPPLTMKEVATKAPLAFTKRTLSYFTGKAGLQTYGPPYTNDMHNAQRVGPICPACWVGVTHPVDFRKALVMNPLRQGGIVNPAIALALQRYNEATPVQQKSWNEAYAAALSKATVQNGKLTIPSGDYGPVPQLMDGMLKLAQAGLLEGALNQSVHPEHTPYNTDYTLSLFYMGGDIYNAVANHFHEQGGEWGMSHAAGPYPGAWWLWPYTFLYQIPAIGNSPNADLIAGMIIGAFALILFFLPFIPGLNKLPYVIPVYKLIWRDWYRQYPSGARLDQMHAPADYRTRK
jgi:hypothetical protein